MIGGPHSQLFNEMSRTRCQIRSGPVTTLEWHNFLVVFASNAILLKPNQLLFIYTRPYESFLLSQTGAEVIPSRETHLRLSSSPADLSTVSKQLNSVSTRSDCRAWSIVLSTDTC